MSLETPNFRSMNLNGAGSSGGNADEQFHLPKIVHPATRVADPHSLNVNARSLSRTSSLGELVDKFNRPNEVPNSAFKKSKRFESQFKDYNIPEGVRAIYTPDVNRVSMPIFGSRPGSSASSVASNSYAKVDITEHLNLLREKVKSNFHETKTRFRNADPDGRGGLSKEAFAHLIASILGPSKPLSHQQFVKLIEKLGLKNRQIIKYDDFVSCFQDNKNEFSDWIDPVRSNGTFQTPINRKATQVFVILKEKANIKSPDMTDFLPSLVGGQSNKIFKPELLNLINGMAIKMEPEEFDKLWRKFDPENTGFVKSDLFIKRLGIQTGSSLNDSLNGEDGEELDIPLATMPEFNQVNKYKVRKLSKKNTNPIEKWLKKQFRNGFSKIKSTFEELDVHKTGLVRRDQFLNVLRQHGFKLESNFLDAFIERCDMHVAKNSSLISYVEFLEKFQNRSDQGLAYRLIAGGSDLSDNDNGSNIGQVERRLLRLFQNDFLGLLQIFRKIDRTKSNMISKQEFRAAIESHFSIELTDFEFEEFLSSVPKDGNRIKYLEFMTRFDSDSSSTLFDSESINNDDFAPRFKKYDTIVEENENDMSPRHLKGYNGRKKDELKEIIKEKIKNHYKEVESAWNEVDSLNSKSMSKDMMWQLFKKLKIDPQFTREEIDMLWSDFILKDNKKLEYWQFVRHFGYSKKSAAFTNAKRAPPQRGDNDMMLTSNKLGRDSILIRGSVQAKLILQFDILKRSFQEIDPYFTNFILRDEFEEILRELCPELNRQEMEYICSKHESPSDTSKINYSEFLEPYAPRRNREKPSDSLKESEGDLPSSRLDMNDTLILKLRLKLGENYKQLRRTFKQFDAKQTGFVTITGFRDALKTTKVSLTEEDMYSLMRKLDKDVTGMINYNKFINDILKN